MAIKKIDLEVSLVKKIPESIAFYDREVGILNILIKPKRKIYSFIETEDSTFDLDQNHEIIDIELRISTKYWLKQSNLSAPKQSPLGKARIQKLEEYYGQKGCYTNSDYSVVYFKLNDDPVDKSLKIASNVILDINFKNQLVGVWSTKIVFDYSAEKELTWWLENHEEYLKYMKKFKQINNDLKD